MSDIDLGASWPIAFDVYDEDGALANANTVTLTVTLPDGTTETPVVANPPEVAGQYRLTYLPELAGRYSWSAVTTVPNAAYGDMFSVRSYAPLISLAGAKAHLNITRPSTDGDAELRRFIAAASELVESKVGICARRAFTDRVMDGARGIVLPRRPVLSVASVTSVWPGGPVWHAADLVTDLEAGITAPLAVPFWWGPWDVAYTCGRAVIPERFEHACKEQLRHLWETQRGAQPPAVLPGEEVYTATSGWSFSVPRRVLELLEQDMVPSS